MYKCISNDVKQNVSSEKPKYRDIKFQDEGQNFSGNVKMVGTRNTTPKIHHKRTSKNEVFENWERIFKEISFQKERDEVAALFHNLRFTKRD